MSLKMMSKKKSFPCHPNNRNQFFGGANDTTVKTCNPLMFIRTVITTQRRENMATEVPDLLLLLLFV